MNAALATTRVAMDPTNPGQFFACCGLFELAERLMGGVEAWFEKWEFMMRQIDGDTPIAIAELLRALSGCRLTNTMSDSQLSRLEELSAIKPTQRESVPGLVEEKKALEKLRREAPILLHAPLHIRIDWFLDDRAGGDRFKTWAGQQSVLDIATAMKQSIDGMGANIGRSQCWLAQTSDKAELPFNFDSDLGAQSSALDMGFSMDPLAMTQRTRPFIEFLAFIGLQRFRPMERPHQNRFTYVLWTTPLSPAVAAGACCGAVPQPDAPTFEFPLLYRTKYLKSFLSAKPSRSVKPEEYDG